MLRRIKAASARHLASSDASGESSNGSDGYEADDERGRDADVCGEADAGILEEARHTAAAGAPAPCFDPGGACTAPVAPRRVAAGLQEDKVGCLATFAVLARVSGLQDLSPSDQVLVLTYAHIITRV